MIMRWTTRIALAALAAAAAACAHRADPAPTREAAESGKPPVAVAVVQVTTAELVDAVDVVGSLSPKVLTDVKSEVTGVVDEVFVTEWVPVKRNAPLARLDSVETAAALDALKALEAQARVAETRARREAERARNLQQYGLITPQAFDDAQTAVEAMAAATAAAHAQVRTAEARLAKALIRSPIDGVVAERFVNVGDRVENVGGNTPMFRIVDNRLLDLTVTVPTADLRGIRVGETIEFTTDAVPGRTFAGKVHFINPAVDEISRSAKVSCDVPNPGGLLKGGLFVKGRIVTARRPGVIQVPREALVNWNVEARSAEVFVVRNNVAKRVAVQTGTASGMAVEIAGGLAAGERVVTRGAFALREDDKVTIANAGA